jgi:O-antigen ligase
MCLLAYAAVSVVWSDFPYVAFKRYIKYLGLVAMALVVLTDNDPVAALKALIRRSSYLLIPASVLLVKYYRHLGVVYDEWSGAPIYQGVADSKNMLGQLCLVLAISLVWVIVTDWPTVKTQIQKARRATDIFVTWLAIDTLLLSDSVTSLVCLAIGTSAFLATRIQFIRQRVGVLLAAGMLVAVTLQMTPGLWEQILTLLGRDPTLTNRTDIWSELWVERGNLLIGTGFDSFWLGERAARIRNIRNINEAHNGYLEVTLQLGLVGLMLQLCVLTSAYRNCQRVLREGRIEGRLFIAYFVIVLVYNLVESGFRGMGPINFVFLLITANARGMSYAFSAAVTQPGRVGRVPRVLVPAGVVAPYSRPGTRTAQSKWRRPGDSRSPGKWARKRSSSRIQPLPDFGPISRPRWRNP